jgi:hypothetical protein
MYLIRLHVHGQPVPLQLPGWPNLLTAAIVRNILFSNPLVITADIIEVDAPRDLFASIEESEA